MTMTERIGVAGGILFFAAAAIAVNAGGFGRQYYGNWSHYPSRGYYYCALPSPYICWRNASSSWPSILPLARMFCSICSKFSMIGP